MPMTMTEKILARHAGREAVQPGQTIWCDVDTLMTHDICGPGTIGIFHAEFGQEAKVWDPRRVVVTPDHYIFTADEKSHRNIEILRAFARQQGLAYYYDPDFLPVGGCAGIPPAYDDPTATSYAGVCHVALPEKGHVRPGEVLIGTDSHTCTAGAFNQFATGVGNSDAAFVLGVGKIWLRVPATQRFVFRGEMPPYLMAKDLILHVIGELGVAGATYCAMEFDGRALLSLNMDERCTLPNMAIEAGGKNGILPADEVTEAYVRARTDKPFEPVAPDADAAYERVMEFDAGALVPTVAQPHSPDNRAAAADLGDVKIDRCYVGSCTGGKFTDILAAAKVLAGRTVAVETFVVPATPSIDARLDAETIGDSSGKSIRRVLLDAGCKVGPASCAACLGGPADTFGRANEPINVLSATNRNFPGRMGHKKANVFLASPLTVAATALRGRITDPRDEINFDRPVGLCRNERG